MTNNQTDPDQSAVYVGNLVATILVFTTTAVLCNPRPLTFGLICFWILALGFNSDEWLGENTNTNLSVNIWLCDLVIGFLTYFVAIVFSFL